MIESKRSRPLKLRSGRDEPCEESKFVFSSSDCEYLDLESSRSKMLSRAEEGFVAEDASDSGRLDNLHPASG
jgi:hypothetical protein